MDSLRSVVLGVLLLCTGGVAPLLAQTPTSTPTDLTGSWALNRQLSQFPREVGFSTTFLGPAGTGAPDGTRRDNGSATRVQSETADDASRIRFLTDEVRIPYDRLTIAVTPAIVTITPDRAPARTFQPGRRAEEITLVASISSSATATWDEGRLVIVYRAQPGRTLRYVYSVNPNPKQLIVDVTFIDRGEGDKVRRVYEPAAPALPAPTLTSGAAANPAPPAATTRGPLRAATAPGSTSAPAGPAPTAVDQRFDAALTGLTQLGFVFEDLGPDAAKCGLKQDALEAAVTKRLTDAGFRVARNSDEDTYLYVNINTVTASTGLCVSRYDVTLYSHAAARLPHTTAAVPLQVELMHKGGLAGGGPADHADGVMKSIVEAADQFSTRMRNANR